MDGRSSSPQPDPLRQVEARAYQRARRLRARVAQAVALLVVLAAALLGAQIADALETPGPLALDALVYVLVLGAAFELSGLPIAIWGHRRSREAGLSRQALTGWLADRAKGWAIGLILGAPAVALLIWAQRTWPDAWWLAAALGAVAVGLLLALLGPVVILPLFLRSHRLDPGPLANDLLGLARAAGVRVESVRVLEAGAKTSAANAFVAGFGPTRRIMLFDTLVGEHGLDPERHAETRAVLAHELGHQRAGDLWRMTALGAVTTAVTFALAAALLAFLPGALAHEGPGSFSALPALALCLAIAGWPFDVLGLAYSRRRERAADRFGVEVGGDGEAFARALEQLCATNLAELRPPRLYALLRMGHPPPAERIEAARAKGTALRARMAQR